MRDGEVQTVEAVLGRGLTIQCHLPGIDDGDDGDDLVRSWQRWPYHYYHQGAGPGRPTEEEPSSSRRRRRRLRRRHRHRRVVSPFGAALRFASIREEDEGLYRCAGSYSTSQRPRPRFPADISSSSSGGGDDDDDVEFNRPNDPDDNKDNKTTSESLTPSPSTTDGIEDDVSVAEQRPELATTTTTIYGSFIYVRVQGRHLSNYC